MKAISLVCLKKVLLCIVLTVVQQNGCAQAYIYGGLHQNFVRTRKIEGATPIRSYHFGADFNVYSESDTVNQFITYGIGFIEKGYDQSIGGENFVFRFRYATTQVTVSYLVLPFLSVKGGVNGALLFHSNVYKWHKKYTPIDVGLIAGFNLFENRRVALCAQVNYGLLPMVIYYDIDPQGNFNDRLYELRNTSIMTGLKVRLHGRKIRL